MDYQDQLLDATNRQLLEHMLQDYREGKETDERLAAMLRTYADGLAGGEAWHDYRAVGTLHRRDHQDPAIPSSGNQSEFRRREGHTSERAAFAWLSYPLRSCIARSPGDLLLSIASLIGTACLLATNVW